MKTLLLSFLITMCQAVEIPDPVMVSVVTTHVKVTLHEEPVVWISFDIIPMSHAAWIARFGEITKEDKDFWFKSGCLRFLQVLHHYEL